MSVTSVFIFLCIIYLSSKITKPITRLTNAATEIGKGRLDIRLEITTDDELGKLSKVFNEMVCNLKELRDGLIQKSTELKNTLIKVADEKAKTEAIIAGTGVGIIIQDLNYKVIYENELQQKAVGHHVGEYCYQAYEGIDHICEDCPMVISIKDGGIHTTERSIPSDKGMLYYELISSPLRDSSGEITGGIKVVRDITKLKLSEVKIGNSLIEKEILLKEIHHRVKNNLQVVTSMLQLQAGYIKDREARTLFEESQKRIESMSLIHDKLYRSKDLTRIDFREYVVDLTGNLLTLNTDKAGQIEMKVDIEGVVLDVSNSIPCGLIINELVSNALRHAFPDGRNGKIDISMHNRTDNRIRLSISDNGIGFPEDLDFKNTASLGMQLVNSLVRQLNGLIELDRTEGTAFRIEFQA